MFRVIYHYDGLDSENCISLKVGDVLSAVQHVDDYWCIGHNERSGETGAFPASSVREHAGSQISKEVTESNQDAKTKETDTVEKMGKVKKGIRFPKPEKETTIGFSRLVESDKFGKLTSSTDMLFNSGRDENKRMKAVFGVFSGILIGGLIYVLLVYSFDYSHLVAGIMVALITILMCVALALWSACRCVMALVFPNFFTSKGRGVMMSIILSLLLSGPIQNITNNSRETGSSMACIAEVVGNQTKVLRNQLAEPMIQMAKYAAKNKKKLAEAQKDLTNVIDTFMNKYRSVEKAMGDVKDQMNGIYQKCITPIDEILNSCVDKCELPFGAKEPLCLTACSLLSGVKNVCSGTNNFVDDISTETRKIRNVFDQVENYFKADVVVSGNFDTTSNSSKDVDSIKADIDEDIHSTVVTFKQFTFVAKKLLSLTLLLMFLQAFWYFRNYMAKDKHDNKYITKAFIELDNSKANMGESAILPLKKRELSKYITTRSLRLTSVELSYCKKGMVQVMILLLMCVLVIVIDYCLYYVLNLVQRFSSLRVTFRAESGFTVTVKGSGPIAAFYRILLEDLDIYKQYLNAIDVGGCLPKPTEPSREYSITAFMVLFVILLGIVVMRAYGMRLRRKIAAYYYPEQERQREEYLYKVIKHDRQAYQRFIRQEVKSAHKESTMKEKFRFSTWIKTRCPCCRVCLSSRERRHCNSCEETDPKVLTNCNGLNEGIVCTAIYCNDCRQALNGVCPLCNKGEVEMRE